MIDSLSIPDVRTAWGRSPRGWLQRRAKR